MSDVPPTAPGSPWEEALLAASLLAVDPVGLKGAVIRARFGAVRDRWQAYCQAGFAADAPMRRLPVGVPDGRLLGGLDLAATLRAGKPVAERGLLVEVDGGVLVLAMADQWSSRLVADDSSTVEDRVRSMFVQALGRQPEAEELARWATLIESLSTGENVLTDSVAWKHAAHTLFNLQEFVYHK